MRTKDLKEELVEDLITTDFTSLEDSTMVSQVGGCRSKIHEVVRMLYSIPVKGERVEVRGTSEKSWISSRKGVECACSTPMVEKKWGVSQLRPKASLFRVGRGQLM